MRADALGLFWQDMPKVKKKKKEVYKCVPPEPTWLAADYLPYLKEARAFIPDLLTFQELSKIAANRTPLIYDIECYINYFCAAFIEPISGKSLLFEFRTGESFDDSDQLKWVMENCLTVGFNSINYDNIIVALACNGKTTEQLKAATNMIIEEGYRGWEVLRKARTKKLECDHIDIIEVAPGFGSLKIYGGRCATQKMQDLPFHPALRLTDDQVLITRFYCFNDLQNTYDLFLQIQEPCKLRLKMSKQYKLDLRSRSDAQIAEAVIAHELEKLNFSKPCKPNVDIGTVYKYNVPDYMEFKTPGMQRTLNMVRGCAFVVGEKGTVETPPELYKYKAEIGTSTYTMGIGGLHSNEKSQMNFSSSLYDLEEIDVESYYPRIILNQCIYPTHLGPNFLKVFDTIVTTRLDAKHNGDKDTAGSLKIVINGTFGKLGSPHSIFYSPDLLIQVTLSGQLTLMMLAEELELNGIAVVSGNTDGIVVKVPKAKQALKRRIVKEWEEKTRFVMEVTPYLAILNKDVNNYYAVKKPEQGESISAKRKGIYAKVGLMKNPTCHVCADAVAAFLSNGTKLRDHIMSESRVSAFLAVRTVAGGAVATQYKSFGEKPSYNDMRGHLLETGWEEFTEHKWIKTKWREEEGNLHKRAVMIQEAFEEAIHQPVESEYLGKAIRWYYCKSNVRRLIVRAKNGNKVPRTDSAKPMMELLEKIPEDLDYDWYIKEAQDILKKVGYVN